MKTKKLKIMLVLVAILAILLSTITLATSDISTTSADISTTSEQLANTTGEVTTQSNPDATINEGAETTGTSSLEQHEGDYFKAGFDITVDKAINGTAYVFGNNVTITGQINGDLFVSGSSSVTIAYGSVVTGTVYVLTPNLKLDGLIYSLYGATDKFVCEYNGMAALDLKVLANTIDFSGFVERHVYFGAAKSLTLNDDAFITGNFNYAAADVSISENATLKGQTYKTDLNNSGNSLSSMISGYTMSIIGTLVFVLVALLALLVIKPSVIQKTTTLMATKPFKTLGLGILGLVLIPILSVICLIIEPLATIGLLLLVLYVILMVISTIIVTIALANLLDKKIQKTQSNISILGYVLVVGLVLWILTQIPYLGIIVTLLIWIFGIGTIINSLLPVKNDNDPKVETKKEEKLVSSESKTEEVIEESNKDEKDNEDNK